MTMSCNFLKPIIFYRLNLKKKLLLEFFFPKFIFGPSQYYWSENQITTESEQEFSY